MGSRTGAQVNNKILNLGNLNLKVPVHLWWRISIPWNLLVPFWDVNGECRQEYQQP